ncbi:MAG: hypothetical protein JO110_24335 [Acetobacteraceae bacterium]|nr:hypothetical protein [Acetobacteraceae bacterium]
MNLKLSIVPLFFLALIPGWAGTPEAKVVEQPPATPIEPWQVTVGVPGWLVNVSGTTGFRGVNANMNIDVGKILWHTNAVASLAGEVRYGRFSAVGDFLYLNAQAGVGTPGLVSNLALGLQNFIGEFGLSYRLLEGARGWLDLLCGFRYTYLGEQVGLGANNQAINAASTALVDQVAERATTPGSDLNALIQQEIDNRLTALKGQNPPIPVGPLAGRVPEQVHEAALQLIEGQQPELAAAIRAGAQARVNQLKARLASQVANLLGTRLNESFSFYDNWVDPVIGLRGRVNLSQAFYLTAESDVGGFGIGSDVAVQEYAALGCQITRNLYSEVGYRFLYDDFRDTNFLYQMALHGAQITVGLHF